MRISELLLQMTRHFDINEGFNRHLEKTKESQKKDSTFNPNLINNDTLLRILIEAMCECGIFCKALEVWEELIAGLQTWELFQVYVQDS